MADETTVNQDYDRLLAFLDQHKTEILAEMENDNLTHDDHLWSDPKHYLVGLMAFMDLPKDRFLDLMNYVSRNQDFLLAQLDYETKYREVPVLDVSGMNELLIKIHDQNRENGYRWCEKLQHDIDEICTRYSDIYLHGTSHWNITRSEN